MIRREAIPDWNQELIVSSECPSCTRYEEYDMPEGRSSLVVTSFSSHERLTDGPGPWNRTSSARLFIF